MSDRCGPCEDHAKLHNNNVFGVGPANDPCGQCEQHQKMHASEGCALMILATVAVTFAAGLVTRKKP